MSLQTFTDAYVECAMWASVDEEGEPLDMLELSDDARADLESDAKDFYDANSELWASLDGYSDDQAGHDFWLTRNGHGAGFWDRGIGDVGDTLTKLSESYGDCYLYVGDDGMVHV